MKIIIGIICSALVWVSIFCLTGFALSAEPDQLEITDQVTEMAPDGSYLQIGDYGIVQVDNVWQELIPGEISQTSLNRITVGATVRVRIISDSNSEQYIAEELYLLNEGEQVDSSSNSNSEEIYLEDGTWKN